MAFEELPAVVGQAAPRVWPKDEAIKHPGAEAVLAHLVGGGDDAWY